MLSDVEAVLESVPGVEQAVALVQDDPTGAQRLVAYVTPASADGAAVLAAMRGKLPAHLMPASVTALPQVCSSLFVNICAELCCCQRLMPVDKSVKLLAKCVQILMLWCKCGSCEHSCMNTEGRSLLTPADLVS